MWAASAPKIRRVKIDWDGCTASAIRNDLPALKIRVNLLLPSLNCCLDRGFLRGKSIRHVELSLGHTTRIMFFDGELRAENLPSLSSCARASMT